MAITSQSSRAGISQLGTASVPMDLAWDEAFLRVESYLRAHNLESRVLLNQLAADIIQAARARASGHPDEEPVVSAMHVMYERIGAWFARAGRAGDWADARVRMRGRLALVLADLPGRWANGFLSSGPVPAEFSAALISGVLQPGPELRFSNMAPAPLEFGFDHPGAPHSVKNGGWPVLRAAAGWLLLVGFYGVAWAATH